MHDDQERQDVYIFPPNFIESGTFFGGMLKVRNVIEAGILALAVGVPVFNIETTLTTKIIILCLTALPLAILGIVGIAGESLSSFAVIFFRYLHNKRVVSRVDEETAAKSGRKRKRRREKKPPVRAERKAPKKFREPAKDPDKTKHTKQKPQKKARRAAKRGRAATEPEYRFLNPVSQYIPIGNRSMLALKLEPIYKSQAKENQRKSLGRGKKGSANSPNLFSAMDTREEIARCAGVSSNTLGRVRKIVNEGTDEHVERIKQGGKGNSISTVYKEVRKAQALAPYRELIDSVQPAPKDERPNVGSAGPPKNDLDKIRSYVAELKNPDLDRSFTVEMFMAEYAAFTERFIRSLNVYTGEPYIAIYPQLKARDRKKLISLNEKIIEAIRKNISICEENSNEKTQ